MEGSALLRARRKSHQKSRRGCRNCKSRHIKCGEESPECLNCQKIKWVCSGYDGYQSSKILVPFHQDLKDFRNSFLPRPQLLSEPSQSSRISLGANGSLAISFFQSQTLPMMCSVFPSELWGQSLLALGRSEPAIMHLVVAIGTYHWKMNSIGVKRWQKPGYIDSADPAALYALQHHTEAARLMRESAGSKDPPIRIIKLACVLFTILEFLGGSRRATIPHLLNGIRLVESSGTQSQLDPFEREINSTLSRLSLLQSLYGRPRATKFPALWIIPLTPDGNCVESFTDLYGARASIMNLCCLVLLFVRKVEQSQDSPQSPDILAEQEHLGSQLLQWAAVMDEFASGVSDDVESRAIELLRGYHSLSKMFLKTATTGYQTSFDQYIPMFRSIVDNIEMVLNTSQVLAAAPILFSLDLGIIPCLFYTAIKCRHPQIRRRAVALLRRAPLREGLWNAEEAAIVAEQAIKFEEQYVGSDDDGGSCWIPEEARIHDVDIREVIWDGEPSLSVFFKRRPYAGGSLEESHVYIRTS